MSEKMPITLGSKKISLTEKAAEAGTELKRIYFGTEWDIDEDDREDLDADMDFDGIAVILGADKKMLNSKSFIYYGNGAFSPCKSLEISKDNLTGDDDAAPNKYGETDDEFIVLDLDKLPEGACHVDLIVNLHGAKQRGQSFGDATSAIVRILNLDSKEVMETLNLDTKASNAISLLVGTVSIKEDAIIWKVKAEGLDMDHQEVINSYL